MRILIVVLLVSLQSTLLFAKGSPKTNTGDNKAQSNMFLGQSEPRNHSASVAAAITLPDPDAGLKEEATSDGMGKCLLVFKFCQPVQSTFRTTQDSAGNSYGSIWVRGNNLTPEVDPVSPAPPKEDKSAIVPPKGSICGFDKAGGPFHSSDYKYTVTVYYSDTDEESELGETGYIEFEEISEYFVKYKKAGLCESYRIID
jgi:hypothetical protein